MESGGILPSAVINENDQLGKNETLMTESEYSTVLRQHGFMSKWEVYREYLKIAKKQKGRNLSIPTRRPRESVEAVNRTRGFFILSSSLSKISSEHPLR